MEQNSSERVNVCMLPLCLHADIDDDDALIMMTVMKVGV